MRRRSGGVDKVSLDMTPMIDVVFQLLVFFLFTMKVVPEEAEIAVTMPESTAGSSVKPDDLDLNEKITVELSAGIGGGLSGIKVGQNAIGADFKGLTGLIKDRFTGGGKAGDLEIEIYADPKLHYFHTIRGANAIMRAGVSKINFADRKPAK